MKKSLIQIFVCAACVCQVACNDFLNVVPQSELTFAASYKNDEDFKMAIAGVYAKLKGIHQTAIMISSLRSDDVMMMPDITHAQYQNLSRFRETDTNPALLSLWLSYWGIINQCNVILDKIDVIEFRDADMKNYIKGEAHLIRAFSYWTLAYQFGGVPLIDKEHSVEEILTIPRSTAEESFAFAAADYQKAVELLPEEWPATYKGRATKYAAEGMLARLYLFQSKFAEAKPLLNDIVMSGKFAMENEYVDCFMDSKDNGPERVWEAQFIGGQQGQGQGFSSSWYGEALTDKSIVPVPGSNPYPVVTDNLYAAYESGDKRRDVSILVGWGQTPGREDDKTTMFCIKYIHHNYTPVVKNDWANNIPLLRYTDVKLMYAEALNETGYIANGEAFSILNEVRERAGLPTLTDTDLPDQQSFREALRKERRVEFAFEGLRWGDLLRWGIALDVMNNFLATTSYEGGAVRYHMESHQTLFPIPFAEIYNYNNEAVMWQNPGY
jgi:hypothetical protein